MAYPITNYETNGVCNIMTINYARLARDVKTLLTDLGASAVITHAEDDSNSSVSIVFSATSEIDKAGHTSTLVGTEITAFISAFNKRVCVGDSITTNKITYRVNQAVPYIPNGITVIGYKVIIEA